MRGFPFWGFLASRRVGSPWRRGSPSLEFSGIPPEGLSGPAPTGGLLSCTNKKVTKEVARGPLPAPWTPGAVVPDLQPLLAFRLEPSSGLSAAWVDTRRPPPLGGAWRRGWSFRGGSPTEGGIWRRGPLSRLRRQLPLKGEPKKEAEPPPLSKGRLRGVGAGLSVSAHQPPLSEGEVASKLPPASLPPWGEGRERGPPYFSPQGILIPSGLMLPTGDSYGGSR